MAVSHLIFASFITLLIAIQSHRSIHYNSSHSLLSLNDNKSCTSIPSLCLYTNPSNTKLKVTFKEYTFDYFDDSNWSKVIKLNPHMYSHNDPHRRRLGLRSWARERREKWREKRREARERREERRRRRREERKIEKFKEKYGSRWREKYEKWKQKRGRDGGKRRSIWSRVRKNGARAISVLRMLQRANEWRQHRKLYKKLYKIGKMIGETMRKNERYKRKKRRKHRCGCQKRRKCPCRKKRRRSARHRGPFRTVLGPPHVVGHPSFILGSMPMHSAPVGFYSAFPFGAGVQTTMPMIMNRRRMYGEDEVIKKCVILQQENVEICLSYLNGDNVLLEYNEGMMMGKMDEMTRYFEKNEWIWKDDDAEVCGFDVCIQRNEDNTFVLIKKNVGRDDKLILDLMNGEWDVVYEHVVNGNRKLCKYVPMIRLCFETSMDQEQMAITTEREIQT